MIEIADVEFVRGDAEVVIIPIADSDDPNIDFTDPPTPDRIRYVVADDYDPDKILFEAPTGQIDIKEFGDVKPQDPNWPYPAPDDVSGDQKSYPRPPDSQQVIRVLLEPSDTEQFAVTEDKYVDNLVHECEIDPDVSFGGKVTVMQGEVLVKDSATAT